MAVLKKCFHKMVSCCFALVGTYFWYFPIAMFYSLYLLMVSYLFWEYPFIISDSSFFKVIAA